MKLTKGTPSRNGSCFLSAHSALMREPYMSIPVEKTEETKFSVYTSPTFNEWLDQTNGSLAFSTYQVGKMLFLGVDRDAALSVFERTFPRSMGIGLSKDGHSLLLATGTQIYSFDNLLKNGGRQGKYDALFAPHMSWITGNIDIHDIAFDESGSPVFISTLFNCIGTTHPGYSFKPIWKPSFISQYCAEDRCHLNGMAMQGGSPKYVTCVGASDVSDGWRDLRRNGGLLIDVETNDVLVNQLSMPHSPRLHNGRLWLLNSGKGEFGWVDTEQGIFNTIAFLPGFARGLAFVGKYAVIGLSKPRDKRAFVGLPLNDILEQQNLKPWCGLHVIDTETGNLVEWVRLEGVISELYDVSFLKQIKTPSALGIVGPEIRTAISLDQAA